MASSSINIGVSKDELTCTVCLELLNEPVTLICGHSFCHLCVEEYWKTRQQVQAFFCPNCREVFPQKPKLKKNVMLASLVEQVKMRQREVELKVDVKDSGSHCESCNRQAAKLCVPCEILCCEKHVKPHEQKGHTLVEPGEDVGELRCPDHKNSIQLYCIDDGKLMCLMCMDGRHKDHRVVAMKIAHIELKTSQSSTAGHSQSTINEWQLVKSISNAYASSLPSLFKGVLTENCSQVSKSKQHLQSQLYQLQQEVKDTRHAGKGTEDRLEAKRRMLYQYVDEAVDTVKSRVHKVQERKLFLLEKQIEKLQQQMEYLFKAESSLQTSLQELEAISFLGGFKDLVKRIECVLHFQSMKVAPSTLLDFSKEEKNLDSLIELNKNFVEKISKELVEHPEMDEFELSSCRSLCHGHVSVSADGRFPSLDPNSAHPLILISEDLRTATLNGTTHPYPEHPDRFDCWVQVLSSESFSSGHHYWEVDVGSSPVCRIGVALNSMGRKEEESGFNFAMQGNSNLFLAKKNSTKGFGFEFGMPSSPICQEGQGKKCGLGENPESWCIEKNNNRYSALHNNQCTPLAHGTHNSEREFSGIFGFSMNSEVEQLKYGHGTHNSVRGIPNRLGFFLDCEAGELTCFGDSRVLHVFRGNFTDPVKPAFGIGDPNYAFGSVRFCSL